jgi:hypothetical protein
MRPRDNRFLLGSQPQASDEDIANAVADNITPEQFLKRISGRTGNVV